MKGAYININAVLSGVTYYEGNITVPITTTSWVPGTNYVYNITFGDYSSGNTGGGGYVPGSQTSDNKPEKVLTPITITATVTEWVDASDIDIDL